MILVQQSIVKVKEWFIECLNVCLSARYNCLVCTSRMLIVNLEAILNLCVCMFVYVCVIHFVKSCHLNVSNSVHLNFIILSFNTFIR